MRLLIDTHVFLWMHGEPERLARRARSLLEAEATEIVLSAATPWEIAIKAALGKLRLPAPVQEFVTTRTAAARAVPLAITQLHAVTSALLPPIHRDPFDRVLVAQAQLEGIPLLTADPIFRRYGVKVIPATSARG